MAITQIKGSNIEDGTVLAADIIDDSITNAKIKSDAAIAMTKLAVDPTDASNISSGTLPAGRYTDTVYTHPTTAGNKHIPTAGATDQVLTYSSSGTAAWADPAGSDPSLDAGASPANWMLGSAAYQDADDVAGKKVTGEVVNVWTQYTWQGIQTSSTSFVDVPNTSLTVTPTPGNILIMLFTFSLRKIGSNNADIYHPFIGLKVDSTIVGNTTYGLGITMMAVNCHWLRSNVSYRHVATSSSHTIMGIVKADNATRGIGICREHNSNQAYANGQITVTEVKV